MKFRFICLLTFSILVIPQNAFAYIDPGSGSIILQALLFCLAGIALFFRQIAARIRYFFTSSKNSSASPNSENSSGQSEDLFDTENSDQIKSNGK